MRKPMPNPVIPIPEHVHQSGQDRVQEAYGADIHFVVRAIESKPKIDARDITILVLRFGLVDGKVHTYKEIAEYFGLSRQRVYQIDCRTYAMLRGAVKKIMFVG